jgi:hypothetical protein
MRNSLTLRPRHPGRHLAALACALCALALGTAACGSSDTDTSKDFPQSYNAAIAKLDRAGSALATTQTTRKARSSRAIARQLDRFAGLLSGTSRDLAGLEPPKAASAQFTALRGALDRSIVSARRAARAARQIQPARQRAALRQLRTDVLKIARAQAALQRAMNAG